MNIALVIAFLLSLAVAIILAFWSTDGSAAQEARQRRMREHRIMARLLRLDL
jgi:uncharacterized membrane protein YsdA (DUF1294 family)